MSDQTTDLPAEEPKLGFVEHAMVLVIICAICLVGNTVATDNTVADGLVGLIVIYVISLAGVGIGKAVPFELPSVAWISLIAIIVSTPWFPGNGWILEQARHVNFLTLATPCLAYAGIAIAQREIDIAKSSGWKMFIIAVLVMAGTYIGSAFVAQMFL